MKQYSIIHSFIDQEVGNKTVAGTNENRRIFLKIDMKIDQELIEVTYMVCYLEIQKPLAT